MNKYGLYRPFLVGCAFIVSVTSQEQIFVGTRLDGSAIGPYKVRPLNRFHAQNNSQGSPANDDGDFYLRSSFRDDSFAGVTVANSNDRPSQNVKTDSSLEVNKLHLSSLIDSPLDKDNPNVGLAESNDKNGTSNIEDSLYHLQSPSGTNLTSLPNFNGSASDIVSPRGDVGESEGEESIDFELFPYLIDQETDHQNSEINTAQNSSDDLNDTSEVGPIIETTYPVNDGTITTLPALCHASCFVQLEKMIFKYSPKKPLIQSGGSLALECSVPFEYESSVRMVWLFQKINPPSFQCSLTPQENIHLCNNFAAVEHNIDSNLTSKIAAEKVLLSSLTSEDSGYYFCMVELTCCSPDPHIMQLIKKTETPIEVYEESYVLELSVLGGLVGCLLVLLTIGTYIQKKRRKRNYFPTSSKTESQAGGLKDVLHAPILGSQGDSDSFEESEEES